MTQYRAKVEFDDFDAYHVYQSLKLHYGSEKYDALKYNFKTSTSRSVFEQRKDRFFFMKLRKKHPTKNGIIKYLVASFVQKSDIWIGDILNEIGDENVLQWDSMSQNASYNFRQDMITMATIGKFDDLIQPIDGQMPKIINMMLGGQVHLFTILLLDCMTQFITRVNKHVEDTLVWPAIYLRLLKTRPFIRMSEEQRSSFRKIILEEFA
jgi:hypothetical protein